MRRHLHRYATHYVCTYPDSEGVVRALRGPMTSGEVLAWILSQGDIEAQAQYCNASRYALAKSGAYPQNKAGEQKLADDLLATQTP